MSKGTVHTLYSDRVLLHERVQNKARLKGAVHSTRCTPSRFSDPPKGLKPYNSGISLLLVYISKRKKKSISKKNY